MGYELQNQGCVMQVADKESEKSEILRDSEITEEYEVAQPPFLSEPELRLRLAKNPLDFVIFLHEESLKRS